MKFSQDRIWVPQTTMGRTSQGPFLQTCMTRRSTPMKKLWPKVLTKIIWKPTKYEERSTLVFHYSKYTKFKFKTSVTSSWLLFVIYFRGFVRSIKLFMCLQVETRAKNVHNRRKDCTSNIYISLFHSYKTKYKKRLGPWKISVPSVPLVCHGYQ